MNYCSNPSDLRITDMKYRPTVCIFLKTRGLLCLPRKRPRPNFERGLNFILFILLIKML